MPERKQILCYLQPKQEEIGRLMYKTGAHVATWIGGGGARAGGKSGGLRRIMLDRRLQRPGTKGAIVRRIYKDVKENHIDKYFIEFPELKKYWRATDLEIKLDNGSAICFRYAENQQAVDQSFWGPEYYDIFVDQAEQFTERELTIIKSANRWPGAPINDCKTGLFFNPGGVGTEFLRRVFHQRKFHANERPEDFAFVHLFGWDNYVWFEPLGMQPKEFYALSSEARFEIFITQTAEGRKLDTMPPSLRAGHLLGSFESFAGQYFAGVWDESRLILTAGQEAKLVQPWWTRWLSHDDGFVHHAAMIWWVSGKVSPKLFLDVFGMEIQEPVTIVLIYREMVEQGVEQGEWIRRARKQTALEENKTLARFFLSQDAWEKDSHGHSVADTMGAECRRIEKVKIRDRELQITWPQPEPTDNNRIGGWRFLYAMMKKTADVFEGKMHPTRTDDDWEKEGGGYSEKTPLLFVSGNCSEIIDAIPMAITDSLHLGRQEDVLKQPTKADDVLDAVRYGAKSMLNPKQVAPLPVLQKEKWADMGDADVTVKAIQMRKMEAEAKKKSLGRRSAWAR